MIFFGKKHVFFLLSVYHTIIDYDKSVEQTIHHTEMCDDAFITNSVDSGETEIVIK